MGLGNQYWRAYARTPCEISMKINTKDESKALLTKQTQFLSDIEIPVFLRSYIYSTYAKYYQVNTKQIELPLNAYPTFTSFFTRKITRQHPG